MARFPSSPPRSPRSGRSLRETRRICCAQSFGGRETRMAQEFAALAAEEPESIEDDLDDDKTDDDLGRKN